MNSLCGILNINKPTGLTSRAVVNRVVRLVKPAKVGHAGTLDPLATGVLLVCIGPATRLVSHLQQQEKVYRARFRFGRSSNTDDITGEVETLADAPRISRELLQRTLPEFVGSLQQRPPSFSAVHVQGKRAYELARQGKEVKLQPKQVEIHRIELHEFDEAAQECELEICCGSGTYIRSIARDLGVRLGSAGLMTALERTRIGRFSLDRAVSVDDLSAETLPTALHSPVHAVAHLTQVSVDETEAEQLRHGRRIRIGLEGRLQHATSLVVLDGQGQLICLAEYEASSGEIRPRTVFPAFQA